MKRQFLFQTCLAVLGFLVLCGSAWAEDPVYFPDANLKAAIEDELGVTEPTPTDMLGLTYLSANSKSIVNLTGLEYATNLTTLYLKYNQISDISPLSGLTSLTRLYLDGNQISNISHVSGLTNLTSLYLYWNQISDCSAISGLTNLTHLDMSNNQTSNISAVSGLINLTTLDLNDNGISNISYVSGLTNLNWLDLSQNQISNISPLSGLPNLTHLYLDGNQISNISAVSGLTNLTRLFLNNNQISDCNAVSELTELTWLTLGNNQINDCNVVSGLTKLTQLWLYGNQIIDISAVSGLTTLTRLYLYDNQISDISALSEHTNLNVLTLYDNPLNTAAYCVYLPLIEANNSGLSSLIYDPNPNPLTKDCTTDLTSLEVFVLHWLETDCNEGNNWCGWADLDHLHDVDFYDFAELARYWVGGVSSYYIEDFETGDFSKYNWEHSGDANWTVVSNDTYFPSGTCISVRHMAAALLMAGDNKVNRSNWEFQTYTITPGQHTLKWAYTKDGSVFSGSDCAWIDEITMSQ